MKTIFTLMLLLCSATFAGTLPSLKSHQVRAAFESIGLPYSEPLYSKEQTEHEMRGEVEGNLFALKVFGPPFDSSSVTVISALVQNDVLPEEKTSELSLSFLCLAASMPYVGSTPAEARIWIASNIGKNTEKMFGTVKLQLFAEGRTRILRMSTESLIPKAAEGTAPRIKQLDRANRAKSTQIPAAGTVYHEIEAVHGKPAIRDPDTGWATWPTFKVRFQDGKAAEVVAR